MQPTNANPRPSQNWIHVAAIVAREFLYLCGFQGDQSRTIFRVRELAIRGLLDGRSVEAELASFGGQGSAAFRKLVSESGPQSNTFDRSTDGLLNEPESLLLAMLLARDEYALGYGLENADLYWPTEQLAIRLGHVGFIRPCSVIGP